MKEDKNIVFALNSFISNVPAGFSVNTNAPEAIFTPQGYLLFESEERANSFLEMCDRMNAVRKSSNYTKHGYVEVDDFLAGRVAAQKHFYVNTVGERVEVQNPINTSEVEASAQVVANEETAEEVTQELTTNKPKM